MYWQSATFLGTAGHTYGFYSIATDYAGNIEASKTAAEATTHVAALTFPGDLNTDGRVDCSDVAIIKSSLGKRPGNPGWDSRADINLDGVVDVRDLSLMARLIPAGTRCE
jgi:hypothetical protein